MAPHITVGIASDDRIGPFMDLSDTHYADKPVNDRDVVVWRHLDTPMGPSITVELVDKDESVGRLWIERHPWRVGGHDVVAANPIDFLIREDHRRWPNFMSLFRASIKESLTCADLVFHTSNPLTDDLYRKLMRLTPVTELDGAVMPVRPFASFRAAKLFDARFVGRAIDFVIAGAFRAVGRLSSLTAISLEPEATDQDQESVIAAFLREEPVAGSRSASQRAWRFRGAGSIRYQQHWLTGRNGVLGYVVTSDRDIDGVAGRFVVDLVIPGKPHRLVLWALWAQLAGSAARDGRDALFFFFNRANRRLARLAGFPMVTVNRDRLPQRVPVFVRLRPEEGRPALVDANFASGYFVLADFDLF